MIHPYSCLTLGFNASPVRGCLALTFSSTLSAGTAIRFLPMASNRVQGNVTPTAGIPAYVVEEQLPAGVVARGISHEGAHDRFLGAVKWGPFLDDETRILSYRLVSTRRALQTWTGSSLNPPGFWLRSLGPLPRRSPEPASRPLCWTRSGLRP